MDILSGGIGEASNAEHLEQSLCHPPKRHRKFHHESLATQRHEDYTIAWICTLYVELAAARAMLDEIHEPLPTDSDDSNTYVLGSIKRHHVVIACFPADHYGTNNASKVMTNLKRTFSAIRIGLMVGIGGGVPSKLDLRLGDIVVGTRVIQCDFGKIIGDGQLQRTAIPRTPDQSLGTALSSLRAKHELWPSQVSFLLNQRLAGCPGYSHPNLPDRLFLAAYDHDPSQSDCDGCDHSKLVPRSRRISDDIRIHYGAIASGNQVMKSGIARDQISRQLDVICFEMESAGLMETFPCLPIRGISNYSDSHKNDAWQMYAAATAAAYARELLEELPVTQPPVRIVRTTCLGHCVSQDHWQCLLDSLQFERINTRKSTIKAAYARTCEWLLCHSDYQAWLDSRKLMQHHGFLWITGKPGAGKSTIMKFAYSSMRKARHNNMLAASFFFNAQGEYLERSIIGMYRSLLFQLLQGYPDLQRVLEDPEIVSEGQNDWRCLNVLKDLFCDAVSALGERSLTCFIDALDECDKQQVVDMIQYFEDLAESSTANGVSFRICLSSRHYPYFATPGGIRLTLEDQPGHEKDLETYVAGRLRIQDSTLVEELRPQILGKAAGAFAWVILLVDILNQQGPAGTALRMRLAGIPIDENKYETQMPLSGIAQEGRAEMTRSYLPTGVIANIRDERRTPLSRASELGYEAVVRTLIDNGADVNASLSDPAPLILATREGHEAIGRLLIDHGANVNVKDSYGSTPLLYALNNGDLEMARLLIDNGADVNASDIYGSTPLYSASQSGHEVAVRLLIARGADVNVGVEFGLTPIPSASLSGQEAIARLSIDKGA